MNNSALVVLPKVVENKELGDGFYVMKGFHATRVEEGKPDISQFLPVYKTIGFNIDQADRLLNGAAVRHVQGWDGKKPKYGYSQINFQEKTENGNFKMMRKTDDESLLKTLGTIGIIARQEEKEEMYLRLQKGDRIAVNVRDGEGTKRLQIQAAVRKSGPGIDLMDNHGTILKKYPEEVARKLQPLQTVPEGKKVPEGAKNTLTSVKPKEPSKVKNRIK